MIHLPWQPSAYPDISPSFLLITFIQPIDKARLSNGVPQSITPKPSGHARADRQAGSRVPTHLHFVQMKLHGRCKGHTPACIDEVMKVAIVLVKQSGSDNRNRDYPDRYTGLVTMRQRWLGE